MTDIVERLRHHARVGDGWTRPVAAEAADEIERLREEGAEAAVMSNRANDRATALQMEVYYLKAEIGRLRAALRDLLADTQHARHACGDPDCPAARARAVLEGGR